MDALGRGSIPLFSTTIKGRVLQFQEKDEVIHTVYGSGKVTKIFANGGDTIYGVDFGHEHNLFVPQQEITAK
jgi:hypothetical protein|tara:strand:+ start:17727 stop:17942 length:216 start_codon:yes stop_codon:yes gene_type:complete